MKRRFVHPNVRLWLWLFSRALLFIAILEKRKESYSVPKAKKKEYVAKCLSVYLLVKVPMRAVPVANIQARRKVFAIGAANSGEGDDRKGVNFTITTCPDPVPGKTLHNRHQEAHL